jgi:peroxiredoxin
VDEKKGREDEEEEEQKNMFIPVEDVAFTTDSDHSKDFVYVGQPIRSLRHSHVVSSHIED